MLIVAYNLKRNKVDKLDREADVTLPNNSVFNNAAIKKYGSQLNQSLIHGMEVLQGVAASDQPIGSRELSRMLDLDITKVNRLLRTLAFLGLVRQTPSRKYTSGPGMHVLAAQSVYASGYVKNCVTALEELKNLGLIVAMGSLWQDKVTYMYHALPNMDSISAIGSLSFYPATDSGIGLSLLSELTDEEVDDLYANKEVSGFADLTELKAALQQIRDKGFCRVETHKEENRAIKTYTVAINIGSPVYAAIGVSGHISEEATSDIVDMLKASAEKLKEEN